LIGLSNHLVLPRAFAETYSDKNSIAAIMRSLWTDVRTAVVLTDGGKGVHVRQKGDGALWHVPAHKVSAVDTTGAGDCFHGAYALALAEGKPPLECALFANAAAAIAVTGQGGRKALPDRSACLTIMSRADAPVPAQISTFE
jgi:sugar/nucleoside kinase (ribokinase family)